ncbi:hypothetical protein BF93_08625 [Brachybacterium phenoliresistens]|uniref:Glycosyltransferase 2-like domain-containing protein n=1 Tax=Brachybacterium phenoliresistens TaxID=396014 RepID=Z9JPS2_9MICO|nr:glycosyltransferase family 2 protein [Brachybacterium phenoliresistens]EWS80003.1 hypothetical protein BF93_08625 [Brachybacterium phenoliresistens]
MTAVRISVIIPAHRAEGSIGPAIASVLEQGRPDVEVIVVDDASPDATAEAARAAAAAAPDRVHVLSLDANAGVSAARTAGLARARGEIIAFLDADDVQLPGFLDTVDRALTADVDAVVVGRRVRTGSQVREEASRRQGLLTGPEAARAAMRDAITPFPWDKAFRRELLGTEPFPRGVHRFEDLAGVIVALSRARTVRSLPAPLVEYRISPGSLTWGRVPERAERDAALGFVRTHLPPAVREGAAQDMAVLHLLLTVLIAQSAALSGTGADGSRAVLSACRRDLSARVLPAALRTSPAAGIAAALLLARPRLFAAAVRGRTRRRYGGAARG